MAIPVNLAMTAAEFCFCTQLPPDAAWMSCHFSSCSKGLSNLPNRLPPGSLLVLDDQTPLDSHDSQQIGAELEACVRELGCCGVLLDFQRPGVEEALELASYLTAALPCPVAVTAQYARENDAAVFLPPLPCHVPLKDWTAPWQGRQLWIELALDREVITLTDRGAEITPGAFEEETGFQDKNLHCHYKAAVEEQKAVFHLWRTCEDLNCLLEEAEALGIQRAVGLFQELGTGNRETFFGSPGV